MTTKVSSSENSLAAMCDVSRINQFSIGWFSAGITSAVACKMALELYPNIELYYIETGSAHPDNKRFISDCEKWYNAEIKTVKSRYFKNHFEVIEKTRYINGVDGARCTLELKKNVRYDLENLYSANLFNTKILTNQIFGFEFEKSQVNRAIRFMQQYPNSNPLFPLIEKGLDKNNCAGILLNAGIELPKMYELGYSNNNCIGCVKGGKGYWNKIRIDFPNNFEQMKELEIKVGHSCIKDVFLKDLQPNEGRMKDEIMPNCGHFCEVEFADLPDKNLFKVLNGEISIYQAA